jgi:hypothetical protein
MPDLLSGTQAAPLDSNSAANRDLPAWYQQYTANLGGQAAGLAQNLNQQALPYASVAGFNPTQQQAFSQVKGQQGKAGQGVDQAKNLLGAIAPTSATMVDYAQGAVGAPAMETASSIQPWAQGAQDAASGSAQEWTSNYQKYMSPYTSAVVDNIARLGKRNFEDNIMPGVNSSMIGSGQFGSTRNADILSRAGVQAANDITGQQSNALQSGYQSSAGIFAQDAGRRQTQQQMQAQTALAGGNMMQGALSADAGRVQQQGQIQAQTALSGAGAATSALSTAANGMGALSQIGQNIANTDTQSLLNVGNQQQALQQRGYDTAMANANLARTDPWTQLKNQQDIMQGIQLPSLTTTATSGASGMYGPSALTGALGAYYLAQGLNADGTKPK